MVQNSNIGISFPPHPQFVQTTSSTFPALITTVIFLRKFPEFLCIYPCRVVGWGELKKGMQLGLREPTFWRVRWTASPDTGAGLRALEEGLCPWLVPRPRLLGARTGPSTSLAGRAQGGQPCAVPQPSVRTAQNLLSRLRYTVLLRNNNNCICLFPLL